MNWKKSLHICSLILFGFSLGYLASSARFEPRFRPPMARDVAPHRPSHPEDMFGQLGLDSTTLAKIDTIHKQSERRAHQLHEELRDHQQAFEKTMDQSKDPKELQQAFDQFLSSRNQLEKNRFETMVAVHSLLTPEQIHQLRSKPREHEHGGPPPFMPPQHPRPRP
ncbi:MAG: periplasmic heavy metal sensor [Bdellovibrionota bacterium]